jgi:cysteine synthase A
MWAVAQLVREMVDRGQAGSIVTLLCDSGERYRSTILDDSWLLSRGLNIRPEEDAMERFFDTGIVRAPATRGRQEHTD